MWPGWLHGIRKSRLNIVELTLCTGSVFKMKTLEFHNNPWRWYDAVCGVSCLRGPIYQHGLTLIPAYYNNVLAEVIYPFPKLNSWTVEDWKWSVEKLWKLCFYVSQYKFTTTMVKCWCGCITGLVLGLRPANERRRYKVTPSLIGWAQT